MPRVAPTRCQPMPIAPIVRALTVSSRQQSSAVSRMPTGESTASTESTGSLAPSARARSPGTPSKCTSRCRVISITFPSHDSDDIPISLPPHASRPAASNLSNLAFSGTVNQEHQTQHQTQPTPVAACCGDGLDRSCSAPTAVAACTIAARVPENSFMWRKSKRFKISKMKHETVQN